MGSGIHRVHGVRGQWGQRSIGLEVKGFRSEQKSVVEDETASDVQKHRSKASLSSLVISGPQETS